MTTGAAKELADKDRPLGQKEKKLLDVVIDERNLALAQRKFLFGFIARIVALSLLFTGGANGWAIIHGAKVDSAVLVAMTAAMAVQSFLLVRILAVSLYPPSPNSRDKKSDPADEEVE